MTVIKPTLIAFAGFLFAVLGFGSATLADTPALRGTGDLGIIVERASGQVIVFDSTTKTKLFTIPELGDLSHASAVFSRDGRYAFIFGRDGGLSKIDLLTGKLVKRIIQAGNSIGGAISQDGALVAVSNYEPGGVRIFDSATLAPVSDIPTDSKVVGLVDAPGNKFIFTLYDSSEIWIADMTLPHSPKISRFHDIGELPYDGLITPDGHYYLAGLFGEDGIAMLDLWKPEDGVRRILHQHGRGEDKLPVYKMPHLEGWAEAGEFLFLPAVGSHEVLIVSKIDWHEVARIRVHGQPVFVVARPDGRQVWVNFAHPFNNTLQVIDVPARKIVYTFRPGPAVLHMEFTPRGEQVWVSVRDEDKVNVYDTETFNLLAMIPAESPSGIFLSARAHRIGL